jgi:quinol monooxygenase YgiN
MSPLIRIVRLPVEEDRLEAFLEAFDRSKGRIRAFEGCRRLELMRDKLNRHVVFTYSIWDSHEHLDRYLQSELFRATWRVVRPMFNGKPQAWSLEKLQSVEPDPS